MTTSQSLILILLAFAAGVFVGWIVASRRSNQSTRNLLGGASSAEAGLVVCTLERLRTGDHEGAISLLEVGLDSALIVLASLLRPTPEAQRDKRQMQMLRMAREYRARFPRQFDQAVAEAFSLAEGGSGRG